MKKTVLVTGGADRAYSVNELARKVAAAMGVEPQMKHLPRREEVYVAFSDHSASREVFRRIPQTPHDEGLGRMAAWVKAAGMRKSKDFGQLEIPRNLPEAWKGSVS